MTQPSITINESNENLKTAAEQLVTFYPEYQSSFEAARNAVPKLYSDEVEEDMVARISRRFPNIPIPKHAASQSMRDQYETKGIIDAFMGKEQDYHSLLSVIIQDVCADNNITYPVIKQGAEPFTDFVIRRRVIEHAVADALNPYLLKVADRLGVAQKPEDGLYYTPDKVNQIG